MAYGLCGASRRIIPLACGCPIDSALLIFNCCCCRCYSSVPDGRPMNLVTLLGVIALMFFTLFGGGQQEPAFRYGRTMFSSQGCVFVAKSLASMGLCCEGSWSHTISEGHIWFVDPVFVLAQGFSM